MSGDVVGCVGLLWEGVYGWVGVGWVMAGFVGLGRSVFLFLVGIFLFYLFSFRDIFIFY